MKTLHFSLLLAAIATPAALLISGCSKADDSQQTAVEQLKVDATNVGVDIDVVLTNSWNSIKGYSYDKRADFSSGMNNMADKLDEKVRETKAKMNGLPDAAARDRDAAIKEYDDARVDLGKRMSDLNQATADTWSDSKAKAAASWTRVKAAYDKMKASGS